MAVTSVGTLSDLKKIGTGAAGSDWGPNADYVLTRDITITDTTWTPLCLSQSKPFTGTLTGGSGNYKIIFDCPTSTEIKVNGEYGCLFSYVGPGAKFRNLTIDVVDNINLSSCYGGGILCGWSYGVEIDNVIIQSSSNTPPKLIGINFIGGFVGHVQSTAKVTNSELKNIDIIGTGSIGGFVGSSNASSNINATNFKFSGNVTAGAHVGGFAGYISDKATLDNIQITNSHIKANSGDGAHVGGFIGVILVTSDVKIKNSNFTGGTVSGYRHIGGLVGRANQSLTLTNVQVTNSEITGNNYVGGLIGGSHASTSSVTATNCTFIGNVSGINFIGGFAGFLNNTTDINAIQSHGNITGTDFVGGLIGMAGDNTTSPSIKINNSNSSANVTGNSSVGGLVGQLYSGSVTSSNATGNVTSNQRAGGLIGYADKSLISQTHATGMVSSSESDAGGLVGHLNDSSVTLSYATGNVTSDWYAGGLIGYAEKSLISQTYATGTVSSSEFSAGGLVAESAFRTDIKESYATGNVTSKEVAGGLIGIVKDGNIHDCYSTGNVTGVYSGGLIGSIFDERGTEVINCYSTGSARGPMSGGFVGRITNSNTSFTADTIIDIMNCFAFGNYTGGEPEPAFGNYTGRSNAGPFVGIVDFANPANQILDSNPPLPNSFADFANRANRILDSNPSPPHSFADFANLAKRIFDSTPLLSHSFAVTIDDSYYWEHMYVKGLFINPADSKIPQTAVSFTGDYSPISKDNVWFTYAPAIPNVRDPVWKTWDSNIWAQAEDSGYGLPVLKWQIEQNAPIPNGEDLFDRFAGWPIVAVTFLDDDRKTVLYTVPDVVHHSAVSEPKTPVKVGFDFINWTDIDGEDYNFSTPVLGDLTLVAVFTENNAKHTVTFLDDNQETVLYTVPDVIHNSVVSEPENPIKAGYKFSGWTLDNESYDFSTPVIENLTLVASWVPMANVTVTFDAGDGSPTPDPQEINYNSAAIEPDFAPIRAGYKFSGWTLDNESYDFSILVIGDLDLAAAYTAVGDGDSSGGGTGGANVDDNSNNSTPPIPSPPGNDNSTQDNTTDPPEEESLTSLPWWGLGIIILILLIGVAIYVYFKKSE